jgi:hypothetical protein
MPMQTARTATGEVMDRQQNTSLSEIALRILPSSLTAAQVRDFVRWAVVQTRASGDCLMPVNIAERLRAIVLAASCEREQTPTVGCDNCEQPIALSRFLTATGDGTVRMATCRVCRHRMTLRPGPPLLT